MNVYKKIPFQLGSEIVLRSPSNPSHRSKSKIIGVYEKEFIMIANPVFAISDNITAIVEGDFLISYLHEGCLYSFKSRFFKKLIREIICIEYPADFTVEQLKIGPRVKVNLEADLSISDMTFSGIVKELSDSGCSFELSKIISLFKGLGVFATFTLPNDQLIKNLECTITNVKYSQIYRKTAIGVKYISPAEEIARIQELVKFCMRFRV